MGAANDPGGSRRQLKKVLVDALESGATVLHVEPDGSGARLRARSSLELREFRILTREEYADLWQNIVDRFGTDLVDPFFEGSFPFNHDGKSHHVRVSMVPTPSGESITLKINSRESKVRTLEDLGLPARDLDRFRNLVTHGRGLVVIAGVSGCGSSTSLSSTLRALADGSRKVLSIDDPIELGLEGVQQIEIKIVRAHPERSVTFERALRAAQLQNPDVIGIGHLRDSDAARAAQDAALSGVLTISRLHAPGAALTVSRLHALLPDAHLLADCLRAVLAQALVRRNCPDCREPEDPAPLASAGPKAATVGQSQKGRGCPRCGGLGTTGLAPVFELMVCTPAISRMIAQRRPVDELSAHAVAEGMAPIGESILGMVRTGDVPFSDYLRNA